jgi:F-type H+-transporting ATPase subunit delta
LAAIAKRYAKALADVSFKLGQSERLEKELIQFEELLRQNRELQLFYTNPAIPVARKKAATSAILRNLGFSNMAANFIFVLIDKHRINALTEIRGAFQQAVNEHLGVIQAEITSAIEVDGETRSKLEAALESLTGKKVLLKFGIDRGLIGGAVTRIGDTIYDGSVRQQLELIRARLSSD